MRRTFLLWVALSARGINRSSPYQGYLMLACLCMRAYIKLAVTTSQCGKFPPGQMFSTIAMFQRHMISYTASRTQSAERNSTATCPPPGNIFPNGSERQDLVPTKGAAGRGLVPGCPANTCALAPKTPPTVHRTALDPNAESGTTKYSRQMVWRGDMDVKKPAISMIFRRRLKWVMSPRASKVNTNPFFAVAFHFRSVSSLGRPWTVALISHAAVKLG